MHFRKYLAGLAAVLLTSTACGGPVAGEASPAGGTGAEGAASSVPSPTTPTGTPRTLDDADPCGLLTEEEVERVSGPLDGGAVRDDLGTARSCMYKPAGRLLAIDVRTNVGLANANTAGETTSLRVGDHEAKTWMGSEGSCFLALGVSSSSRVDLALKAKRGEDPCPFVHELAALLEPRLP